MATKLKIRRGAIVEIMQQPEVLADLVRRANSVAAAAGPGMLVDSQITSTRARASVRTGTIEAIIAQSKNGALTRAIDAGR